MREEDRERKCERKITGKVIRERKRLIKGVKRREGERWKGERSGQ